MDSFKDIRYDNSTQIPQKVSCGDGYYDDIVLASWISPKFYIKYKKEQDLYIDKSNNAIYEEFLYIASCYELFCKLNDKD